MLKTRTTSASTSVATSGDVHDDLRAKVVPLHGPKELGDAVRAHEKAKQENQPANQEMAVGSQPDPDAVVLGIADPQSRLNKTGSLEDQPDQHVVVLALTDPKSRLNNMRTVREQPDRDAVVLGLAGPKSQLKKVGTHEDQPDQEIVRLAELDVAKVQVARVLFSTGESMNRDLLSSRPRGTRRPSVTLEEIPQTDRPANRDVAVTQKRPQRFWITGGKLHGKSFFVAFAKNSLTKSEICRLHKVGVDGPELTTQIQTSNSLSSKSRKCKSFGWFAKVENPLATRLCAHVLAEPADKCRPCESQLLRKS